MQKHISAPSDMSLLSGPRDTPLLDLTTTALLHRAADSHPDHPAAIFVAQGIRWTYADLVARVDDIAAGLLAQGVQVGDRVGIWSPNRSEWLLTQFAVNRIGAILVSINPAYAPQELVYALDKVGCSTLVMARGFGERDYIDTIASLLPELAQTNETTHDFVNLRDLKRVITFGKAALPGCIGFDDLTQSGAGIAPAKLDAISDQITPQDVANIQFTSGTSGRPKGCALTHHNIVNNAYFVTGAMHFTPQDRLCLPVPFYHCFGMGMGNLGCVAQAATIVVPGEGFDAAATLQTLQDEACTAVYGVPTMFVAMLELDGFDQFDLSHMRTGIMAGAPCPIEVMKAVRHRMHAPEITIAYGMTETAPVSFQSGPNDPETKRVSTVGRIHPHVEAKIVDAQGQPLPIGVEGELLIKGYSVMHAYWNDAQRTQDTMTEDGWLCTGDLGHFDTDGYCVISGRVKDVIETMGHSVSPKDIEDLLFTLPGVSQAQVFGVPNPDKGEDVCAWIIPQPGAQLDTDAVTAFCARHLSAHMVPSVVLFRDDMPQTVTGKPQKYMMRKVVLNELY